MDSRASIELMKFLSGVARRLGVAEHVYVVGGAVRNFLIERPIKDIDVVIDSVAAGKDSDWFAKQVARAIPARTNLETNNYGVALLHITGDWDLGGENLKGEDIEIANARKESYGGQDGKGYKPHMVEPATIDEDVVRREFTFNTLLWRLIDLANGPDKAEVIDLTGCGLRDLQEGVARCPQDPDKTFSDDPSRMVRAVKFLVKYGLKPSPDTVASIKRNKGKLKNIPGGHLSNLLINTFLREPTAKRALAEMDKLGLLEEIREIARTDKSFHQALAKWADREAKLDLFFHLMDIGMPVGARVSFLGPEDREILRAHTLHMDAAGADEFVSRLKQPGKIMDSRALIAEFGLKGPEIGELTQIARKLILDQPMLAWRGSALTKLVRNELAQRPGGRAKASHHHTRNECPKCGNIVTCRCRSPKVTTHDLCPDCRGPTDGPPRQGFTGASSERVLRPEGWRATGDEGQSFLRSLRRPGWVFRGMEQDEYKATVGARKPIWSTGAYSLRGEGTNFSEDPEDAESYVNFGRSDPRKSGRPTYLVAVQRQDSMVRGRDGYVKAVEPVLLSAVRGVWRMEARGDAIVVASAGKVASGAVKLYETMPWELTLREFLHPYPDPRPGYVSLFHYTKGSGGPILDSIARAGIRTSGGAVFAHQDPKYTQNEKDLVHFQAPQDEVRRIAQGGTVVPLERNVEARDVLSLHRLWPTDPPGLLRGRPRPRFRSDIGASNTPGVADVHRSYVEAAVLTGQKVPDRVLSDYPELKRAPDDPKSYKQYGWFIERRDKVASGWVAKVAGSPLGDRYAQKFGELVKAVEYSESNGLGDTSTLWLSWRNFWDDGRAWGRHVIDLLAIPPAKAKSVEMAVRVFRVDYGRGKGPRPSIAAWFHKHERNLRTLLEARSWPERSEGAGIFTHGPFRVHNTMGAPEADLQAARKIIDMAVKALPKVGGGFAQMAFGDLYLVGEIKRKRWAAWYEKGKDAIYLRPKIKGVSVQDSTLHLVHEIAHRWWAKKIPAAVKQQWGTRHTLMSMSKGRLGRLPEPGEVLPKTLLVNNKQVQVEKYEGHEAILLDAKTGKPLGKVERTRLREWMGEVEFVAQFPSIYASRDPEEHFCEAAAHKAMGTLDPTNTEAFDHIVLREAPATEVVRLAGAWLKRQAKHATRFVMFDFDGTLFRSEESKPPWWAKPGEWSWGTDPASLGPPCVPERPGSTFWNIKALEAAKKSSSDSKTFVAVITGRTKSVEPRIRQLLGQQGIRPDAMYFNPGETAVVFKKRVLGHLLAHYPITDVSIWENENIDAYSAFVEKIGQHVGREISVTRNRVHMRPMPLECGPLDFDMAQRVAARWLFRTAKARYKNKKEVPKADGKGTTTVYEYSERQVQKRNRDKAERIEKLRGSIDKLRSQVKKDLKSEDSKTRLTALAVGLMDATYERVGNDESAKDGHFGVTGWLVKHVSFGQGKATIKYVGKSGVKQEKVVEDASLVTALKEATKGKGKDGLLCEGEDCKVKPEDVNAYLKPFEISAKDIRGLHANSEMQTRLKAIRSKGGKLPEDKKAREKQLKDEFKQALEEAAEAVGHEPSTLKSQYLVPGLADLYLAKGEVMDKLTKSGAGIRRIQYHATSWDRVPSILAKGIQLPRGQRDVSTFMHAQPSISTADEPRHAQVYHPSGALLELRVRPGAKYLKRTMRQMRKGETLLDAVNRWAGETSAKGADGFWVEGMQSTVGNQTLNPRVLEVVRVVNVDEAPPGVLKSVGTREASWQLDEALDQLWSGLSNWVFYNDASGKKAAFEVYASMPPRLRQAVDQAVAAAFRKAHGGSKATMYRRMKPGQSPGAMGGMSLSMENPKMGEVHAFEVSVSDVFMHPEVPGTPLQSKAFGHEKEAILKPGARPKHLGIVHQNGKLAEQSPGPGLYHVTYLCRLEGIASEGLVPGPNQGRVFLTRYEGVPFWMSRLEDFASNLTDRPEDGWIPVVLRIHSEGLVLEPGAEAGMLYTTQQIQPIQITIWDGHFWVPLTTADPSDMLDEAVAAAETEMEDGQALIWVDFAMFRPPRLAKTQDPADLERAKTRFLEAFFRKHPKLSKYRGIRVLLGTRGGRSGHGQASQIGDHIELYPPFWSLSKDVREFVFAHEIGHWAQGQFGSIVQVAGSLGIDVWDTLGLPFSQFNMDEAFADCFASYFTDRDVVRRYPEWAKLVELVYGKTRKASQVFLGGRRFRVEERSTASRTWKLSDDETGAIYNLHFYRDAGTGRTEPGKAKWVTLDGPGGRRHYPIRDFSFTSQPGSWSPREMRLATKSDAEREDEEVERMSRPAPTKKPPRQDLRRNRIKPKDKDTEPQGAGKDRDLSLNYKRIARSFYAQALSDALDDALMKLAQGKVPADKRPKEEGDYWQTDEGGWGVFPPGAEVPTSAPDEEKAKAMAEGKGRSEPKEDDEAEAKQKAREEAAKKRQTQVRKQIEKNVEDHVMDLGDHLEPELADAVFDAFVMMDEGNKQVFLDAYTGQLREAWKAPSDEGGWAKDVVDQANAALKQPLEGFAEADPITQAQLMADYVFAREVVANPAVLGGKAIGSIAEDNLDALKERQAQAFRQYRRMSPQARQLAGTKLIEAYREFPDETAPERKELEHIAAGLALASHIRGEQAVSAEGIPIGPVVSESQLTLARVLNRTGKAESLLQPVGQFAGEQGRATVREAMDNMGDEELTKFMGGDDSPWQPLAEAFMETDASGQFVLSADRREYVRGLFKDLMADDMTATQAFLGAVHEGPTPEAAPEGPSPVPEADAGLEPQPSLDKTVAKQRQEALEKARKSGQKDQDLQKGVDELLGCLRKSGSQADIDACLQSGNKLRHQALCSQLAQAGKTKVEGGEVNKDVALYKHVCETGDLDLLNQPIETQVPQPKPWWKRMWDFFKPREREVEDIEIPEDWGEMEADEAPAEDIPEDDEAPKSKKAPAIEPKQVLDSDLDAIDWSHPDLEVVDEEDRDEVAVFLADQAAEADIAGEEPEKTDAQLFQEFLAHAKPETKERMKGMTPAEFVKILGAIMSGRGDSEEAEVSAA